MNVRALRLFALWIGLALASASFAAEKRMALVIGNARYANLPLNNPENDARVVSSTLRKLGFEVFEHVNLPVKEFRKVLRDYVRRLQTDEGAAVFYYAGHGVQIGGRNYLLPVDLNLRDEEEIKDEAIDIDELFVSRLDRARTNVRILILDACRDNPFGPKTRAVQVIGGLAEMSARGALIAFSSAPGAAAEDGPAGTNSVFTRHLVKEMLVEGQEVEQMFKNVRIKVMRDTNQRQVPWLNTSLTANFAFVPKSTAPEDAGKREELALLQSRLEQREREQRKLEEELKRLSQKLQQAESGASRPPAGKEARSEAAAKATAVPAATAPPVTATAPATTPAPAIGTTAPAATATTAPPVPATPAPAAPAPATANTNATATAKPATAGTTATTTAKPAPPAAARDAERQAATDLKPAPRAPPVAKPSAPDAQPAPVAVAKPKREPDRPKPEAPKDQRLALSPDGRPATDASARPAGAKGQGSERCVALLIRAQLGETMSSADMAYLQKECR